ncbi:MAG: hypothetical protein ACRDZX_15520 [Acidimicrobiales bacterium]
MAAEVVVGAGHLDRSYGAANEKAPAEQGAFQGRGSRRKGETPHLHFVAKGDPIATEEVGVVLARIVRALRKHKGGEPE